MAKTFIPYVPKRKASQSRNKKVGLVFSYVGLVLMSLFWIIPFVFIVVESFRLTPTSMVGNPFQAAPGRAPYTWGFDNYIKLFTDTDTLNFPLWFFNTFITALVVCVLQTAFVLATAFVFSRFRFKMRKLFMNIILILGMFPGFLTMIILYNVLKDLHMTQENAVAGLILVYVASSGMGYYVSKGYFDTVPKSLDEAARIDGCSRSQVFFRIILPLAKPIVIYTILTAFMGPWGDYIFASYVAFGKQAGYNVAVGLQNYLTQANIQLYYTRFCAAGVIVAIPVTILFIALQKYYVEGVTGGAVKG